MAKTLHFGKFAAVLPAGGLGKRMGGNIPKQLMQLGSKPVYQYSLETFLKMDEIAEVVMAVPADWKDFFEKEIETWFSTSNFPENIRTKLKIVLGGKERWQSVENGVNALTSSAEYVLVHDVARPFISEKIIRDVCETLVNQGSCLVAKPAIDTIKIASDGRIESTIDRNKVWLAQTPQAARIDLLKQLYTRIAKEPLDFTPTDEASILEFFGEPVYIVKGESANDKLTTPEDFEIFTNRAKHI
ncbi:2-C-methyl-D-erythritol 4-phosphate cytidylyltransferase [Fibrobacter sp. UWB11]|uniref:2-C-methyl-D-erythritol 4-phosphate cytidylyltransferase n=1 Tax=Fibrobacter sp. UWB11 TaxID=1896202 RepID=UPI000927E241|nr:2-C-methyl-D-erythritol 4-phosphate cytidylyltransferase [Fibrobacter sp. UWB11]SIN92568.1 2-C-methyl-D-erythritol 4-phosphate cytidylyltransferase [Fibrobacter sp. UWB11]